MHRGAWLVVAALIVPAGAALAQETDDPLRPEIAFPDVEHEERVVPLGGAAEMTLNATISCQKTPLPSPVVWTQVTFDAKGPSFANPIVSPASQVHGHDPVECAQGIPIEADASLSVALTQNAPAFETIDLPVEVTVQRTVQEPLTRTYTEEANASFTVGYFSLVNVRAEEKVAEVEPEGDHTFEIRVDNFSNGPTEAALSVDEAPAGADVEVSKPAVLDPNATATLDVTVQDTTGQPDAVHRVTVDVDARSTDARAQQSSHAEVSLLLGVEDGGEALEAQAQAQQAGAPGPGVGLAAALVALAALLVPRTR